MGYRLLASGFNFAQREVNEILVPGIVEVAQKPTLGPIVAIVNGAFKCAFASCCEIGLHGWSARVEDADCIGIRGPLRSKNFLEVVR